MAQHPMHGVTEGRATGIVARWAARLAFGLIVVLLLALPVAGRMAQPAHAADSHSGQAVYAMTNEITGNRIAVYRRASDGTLTPAGIFPTGGRGSGRFEGSQNSLILKDDGTLLFAVNPGSNDISVLAIGNQGLTIVSQTPSGGMDPTSVTLHANVLYVLNAGGVPNISGFTVSAHGELKPIAGSSLPLSGSIAAVPAQVGFDKDGKVLVVSERNTNTFDTYLVAGDGTASGPIANASAGMEPFGFAFTTTGARGKLISTDAFRGAPGQGAASSYIIGQDGTLQVVSASVLNTQTDTCWIVITNSQRYAYVAHLQSNTVSSYTIDPDGTLALLNPIAGVAGPPGSVTIDEALSNDSHYLYVRNNTTGTIAAFAVSADGSLAPVQIIGGLPPGAIGIAAR